MKKKLNVAVLIGAILGWALPDMAVAAASQPANPVVAGNTVFATDLYSQLKGEEGNLFFCPFSISTALALTYGGAQNNTAQQMAQALHFALDQNQLHPAFAGLQADLNKIQAKGGIQLSVANSLWPHKGYPFLPEYLELTKKHYGVEITACDYAGATEPARKRINTWVEDRTNQKIKDLIPAGVLNHLTRLVLVNAIYFKGDWALQFDPKLTQPGPFTTDAGQPVQAPLMQQKKDFRYGEFEQLQVLAMDYQGGDLSMVVLLPRAADGLKDLEASLTPENLGKWTGNLRRREVQVFFPKFKMTRQFGLNEKLKALGMTDAFDGVKADFSGMDGKKQNLYITAVFHKAFVEVNEEGTEAAAATGVVVGVRSMPPRPAVFRADHPFVFLIRDNRSGSVLFLGRVVDPTQSA